MGDVKYMSKMETNRMACTAMAATERVKREAIFVAGREGGKAGRQVHVGVR